MSTMDTQHPRVPHYVPAKATKESLEYADLPIIDLARARMSPETRSALADQVREAMTTHGFFYAINHGYSVEQTERIFDIANVPFDQASLEEKKQYEGTMKITGSHQGYKLREYWYIDGGVRDQIETYNINRDVTKREHPESLRPLLPEIEAFARHNHFNILHPILRLLALGLEIPEDTFVNMHNFSAVGETYVRFMKYYPRTEEDEAKSKNVWMKGHTDFGTITILYSQPVAALQVQSPDGKWRWVKHIENAVVINAGDAMEFLTGGFYRATVHRVVQPPPDQRHATRLGVFYFSLADDDIKLTPASADGLLDSPVLKRVGIKGRFEDKDVPTMEMWRKSRTSAYGRTDLKTSQKAGEESIEEEVINGIVVKHYN
ncbi:Clavaminate synthase-like protein [Moniliophthora roreri MCA 2997]|uniref:Clavaminate synthase-like protein n=2 Tax=Moniliophthora roreri TaxID=221103 RepID=V2WU31_MONRO|nr:Clavaminate synthase-like protein [Moniliophthora roreri MCA 2997]